MPACLVELMVSAVSRAPHSLPLTQVPCCMRVSLLSRLADFSANGSAMPSSALLQELLLRQSRSGCVPDFCSAGGGGAYMPTSSLVLLRVSVGDPPPSDPVLVSAHTSSWVEGWAVDLPSPVSCASAAAPCWCSARSCCPGFPGCRRPAPGCGRWSSCPTGRWCR